MRNIFAWFRKPKMSNQKPGTIAKSVIAKYIPLNPVIVEAGAHIGIDSLELAAQFPEGIVHAFEPVPNLFQILSEATRKTSNIRSYPFALSNRSGEAKMFVSSGASDGSSSLLAPKDHLSDHPDVSFEKEITVSCTTLDEWAVQYHVPVIDLLWLDLQGHEMEVLKMAIKSLRNVKAIYSEVNLKEAYSGATLYSDYKNWLETQGFRVLQEEIPWEDAGNVLFIRN